MSHQTIEDDPGAIEPPRRCAARRIICGVSALFMLLAVSALRVQGQEAPAAAESPAPLTITPDFSGERFLSARAPISLALSRPLAEGDGRIAIVVGSADVSGLFEYAGTTVARRNSAVPLPAGEQEMLVYLVTGDNWKEVGRFPLKVLTESGFEKAEVKPALSLKNTGQVAEGHSGGAPEPDRPTYQDFSWTTGFQSTHIRNGWSVQAQGNFIGVGRREDALRYGIRQDRAPKFDLSDFVVRIDRGKGTMGIGQVSFGGSRHLINGFSSRGVSAGYTGRVASLSGAVMNGTSIVGWENPVGMRDPGHRMGGLSLGVELAPWRPGAARVDVSFLDGSVRPQSGFTEGGIVDAEKSQGGSVQFSAATPSQRLRISGGVTRSRFLNPTENDPQLAGDTTIVPVRPETRSARWVEGGVGLLQSARVAGMTTSLSASFRHERVDPLFRSVGAYAQADYRQDAADLTGSFGALSVNASFGRTRDNLANLRSVLTSLGRNRGVQVALPLGALLAKVGPASLWPALSVSETRNHSYGEGIPENGEFNASHVPNQVNRTREGSAQWQVSRWRAALRLGHSFQDNRQPGREKSDFRTTQRAIALGGTLRDGLDVSVDVAHERQRNIEYAQAGTLTRLGVTADWRPMTATTLSASVSTTSTSDEPRTNEQRSTDGRLELSRGFNLWRNTNGNGTTRGQLFLRYARQLARTQDFPASAAPADPTARGTWTVSSGLTLQVF